MARILVLTKRQYMNKDLIDDRFGRFREIPYRLAGQGHQVVGLCLSYRRRPEGRCRDGQVEWNSINLLPFVVPGLLRYVRQAVRMARRADVIWACSDSVYGVLAHFLYVFCRKPFVFDLYDNFEYYLAARLPVIRPLYRRAVRKSSAVTCISGPLAGLVHAYGRSEGVFVLENAVKKELFEPLDKPDCRRRLGLPQNARLIGTAGALARNRGVTNLFEAFFHLKPACPDLHLVVAGPRNVDIPEDPRIHYLGVLPLAQVPYVINALDVAVICVKNNDFGKYCYPQKAAEIMACNVPLVAASVGTLRELFGDHPQWLFDPLSVASLAEALKRRLRDPATDYPPVQTWQDLALQLSEILAAVLQSCKTE